MVHGFEAFAHSLIHAFEASVNSLKTSFHLDSKFAKVSFDPVEALLATPIDFVDPSVGHIETTGNLVEAIAHPVEAIVNAVEPLFQPLSVQLLVIASMIAP